MWPKRPSLIFFNYYSVLVGLACNLMHSITVDTLIVPGDCGDTWSRHLWLLQHFATLELSSILFIWTSRGGDVDERWASVVLLLLDTTLTPTILQRTSRPSLSNPECFTPCFVVSESCLGLKDVRLRFFALFWRVCFQRLRQDIQTIANNN